MDKLIAVDKNGQDPDCCSTKTVTSWYGKFIAMLMFFLMTTLAIQAQSGEECKLIGVPDDVIVDCDAIPPAAVVTADCAGCNGIVSLAEYVSHQECASQFVITRTYTATDCSGNKVSESYEVRVVDNNVITMDPAPGDLVVECGDEIPAPANLTASGGCVQPFVTFKQTVNYDVSCPVVFEINRTWTATDDCGKTVVRKQKITVQDTKAPVASDDPADIVIQCTDPIPAVPVVTFSDVCCDPATDFIEVKLPGDCPQEYTIVRTWYAADKCNNRTEVTQTIKVEDNEAPVITLSPDQYIECDERPAPIRVGLQDNCDPQPTYKILPPVRIDGDCPDAYTLVYVVEATDACKNVSRDTARVFVSDNTPPVLTVPKDSRHECDEIVPVGTATAEDNCDDDVTVTYLGADTIQGSCIGEFIVKRVWKAVDDCDNMSTDTQTLYFVDTTPPVLMGVPKDFEVECDADRPDILDYLGDISAPDNCCVGRVASDEEFFEDDCYGYIVWSFWAIDDCGNSTDTLTTTIDIVDNTAPVITVGPDVTVQCDEDLPALDYNITDNCDPRPSRRVTEEKIRGNCPQEYQLIYTIYAEDNCGNKSSAKWTVNVVDTEAPILINVPPCDTFECDFPRPPAPRVTAIDNCDDEVGVQVETKYIEGECEGRFTWRFIYTATDDCGNTATDSTCYEFIDTTPPNIYGVPEDTTVTCDYGDYELPKVTSDDNCCVPDLDRPVKTVIPGDCPQEYCIQYVWTSTDKCGNVARDTFVICYEDNEKPTLVGIPGDITIECTDKLPSVPVVTATDNCDEEVIPVFEETTILGDCPQEYMIVRKWTATDDCENTAVGSYKITVIDTIAPVIVPGPDMEVECTDNEEPGDIDRTIIPGPSYSATDNCDNPVDVDVDTATVPYGCTYQVIYTYNAVDACGNVADTKTQTITVVDKTPPVIFNVPADASYECDETIPAQGEVSTFDACSDVIVIKGETIIPGNCPGNYQIKRTWTAIDACKNTSVATQTITVSDTKAPVITIDPSTTAECITEVVEPDYSVTDNCDPRPRVEIESDTTDGSGCELIVTFTVTATDWCGNTSTAIHNVVVRDNTPPVIEEGEDIVIPCNVEILLLPPTATDNCDDSLEIELISSDLTPGSCPQNYTITYVWVAYDDCGNTDTSITTVTKIDTIAPELVIPADSRHECDEIIPVGTATAEDNCDDNPTVTYLGADTIQGTCTGEFSVKRVWSATDACGNTTTDTQTLYFIDTTPPVLMGVPDDFEVNCEEGRPDILDYLGDISAPDNCCVGRVASDEEFFEDDCYGYIVWSFWAIDDCGNSTDTLTTTIDIVDNTPPVLVGVPADASYQCAGDVPVANVTATDNCDVTLTVKTEYCVQGEPGNPDAPTIALFYDSRYTQVAGCTNGSGDCSCEALVLRDAMLGVGWNVNTFTGMTAGDWTAALADVDALAIPELISESGDEFTSDLTPGVVAAIQAFVASGKKLIVMGGSNSEGINIPQNDVSAYLNAIFGYSISQNVCNFCPSNSLNAGFAAGTAFEGGPATLPPADATFDLTTLPVGSKCIYENPDGDGTVVILPYAGSEIIFYGWDYFACSGFHPDWQDVLERAITQTAGPANEICTDQVPDTCVYVIKTTWTAEDLCGNKVSKTQVINIGDTTPPTLDNAADLIPVIEIDCNDPIPTFTPEWSDNCDLDLDETALSGITEPGCLQTISRSWTATDDCGNSTTVSQEIRIVDKEAPKLEVEILPAEIECIENATEPEFTVSDECSEFTTKVNKRIVQGSGCEKIIWFSVTATDACGNDTTSAEQRVIVRDNTPPVYPAPTESTAECGDVYVFPAPPVATDNCDADLKYSESGPVTIPVDDCEFHLVKTYTATDDCGNQASTTHTIKVLDTTAPELSVPADKNYGCISDVPNPNVADAEASDKCSRAVITVDVVNVEGDDCSGTLLWVFTATDVCGNSATDTTVVTYEDEEAPILVNANDLIPVIEIECNDAIPTFTPEWSDNCDLELTLSATSGISPEGCRQVISRTWSATDDCNNTTTVSQEIIIVDRTAPEITCPADIVVDAACDTVVSWDPATATDDCQDDANIVITQIDGPASGSAFAPGTTTTVTYVADDQCGNTDTCSFTIRINDVTPEIEVVKTLPSCEPVFDPGDCLAYDMVFLEQDHAMILFDDIAAQVGLEEEEYKWVGGTGLLSEFEDGTAHLSGVVYSTVDENRKWIIDAWFENRRTYFEWIALGRFIKGNPANISNLDQWRIYELDESKSVLIGKDDFDGYTLNLTKKPMSELFGFQVGHGGNSFDADFGASTWFFYDGGNGVEELSGAGDFDLELDCDLPTDPICDGMLEVIITGPGDYTIEWMVDGVYIPEFDGLTKLVDLCEGTFKVTITDEFGCEFDTTIIIACPVRLPVDGLVDEDRGGVVEPNRGGDRVLQAFPNPFTDKVSVNIDTEKGETYRLVAFDAAGKVAYEETIFGTGEQIRRTMNLANRGKGLYFLSLQSESGVTKEARVIKAE